MSKEKSVWLASKQVRVREASAILITVCLFFFISIVLKLTFKRRAKCLLNLFLAVDLCYQSELQQREKAAFANGYKYIFFVQMTTFVFAMRVMRV